MEIKLNNIGIVKDSKIQLDGLTVITGKNNSGKTTVGKALYSLLDGACDLQVKAQRDRNHRAIEQLDDVLEELRFLRFSSRVRNTVDEKVIDRFFSENPSISALINREYRNAKNIEVYAHELKAELEAFREAIRHVKDSVKNDSVHAGENAEKIQGYANTLSSFDKAITTLERLFLDIYKDSELINYARESINQTLRVEFDSQIQPARGCEGFSKIEVVENGNVTFDIKINENKVVREEEPVFFGTQYKKVYFIDDPFILDGSTSRYRARYAYDLVEADVVFNPNQILTHADKLRMTLHKKQTPTVLDQLLIDEALHHVKEKIDNVLPGTFDFSSNGDFYICDGVKLSVSNLATGSKMFSIIKMLLEKGELDNTTMLILDEPEAHLHPHWQNLFAEVIVLLVKELDVNILLTTHSPNFMLALDAYMRKYQINKRTNFYQTNNILGYVEYSCVNEDISSIYADFLQYLTDVKVLRNNYLMNGSPD